MTPRTPLGVMLLESGRITQDDVERVLTYQRTHGGFFGQALVALGILSREETDWALANHFDLPFIFPNADAVDRDTAHLVQADWALAHMAVPIVRAGRTVTVVAADPLPRDVIDELSTRTGFQIEMALASAGRIRELIHAVYEPGGRVALDTDDPISPADLVAQALSSGADRFGVSVRGHTALGWWRARGETHRAPLGEGWEAALDATIRPPPSAQLRQIAEGRTSWDAAVERGGAAVQLEAQALTGAGGAELMFTPLAHAPVAPAAAEILLPPTLMVELRLLWRSGAARIGVSAPRLETARALLPLIPALAVGEHVRAAHINETGEGGSAYTLRADRSDDFAEVVATYGLDAITIDLPLDDYPIRALLRAAPLALLLLRDDEHRARARDSGLNWLLTITGEPGSFGWQLRALNR